MSFVFYINKFVDSSELKIPLSNRSFKYGDGLFESLLIANQNPVFIEYNLRRLLKGMQLLEIEIPETWDSDFFKTAITRLAKKNKLKNARCRITVWRSGEGQYLPEKDTAELLIELFQHDRNQFELNADGLRVGVYDKFLKMIHPFSSCKTSNALPSVMAAKYAQEQNLDDVVQLNTNHKIAEAISSNVFIVKNNAVYTTTENNGGVEGTMQQIICDNAEDWGINLHRIEMRKEEILIADDFFLTNAIQGIRWVRQFEGKEYENNFSKKIILLLNQLINK